MPGKRARPVWREVARKRPEFTKIELGTSPGGPPYQGNDLPGKDSNLAEEDGKAARRAKGHR